MAGLHADEFTRRLSPRLCARLQPLEGDDDFGVTAATTAVEADAAAVVVVANDKAVGAPSKKVRRPARLLGVKAQGGDTAYPALAPIAPAVELLTQFGIAPQEVTVTEMMEAFAVQAMVCIEEIGLEPSRVNCRGGALAWGHPIGASGAILAVRLFHALRSGDPGDIGLAAIAAAGGLGSAMLLQAEGGR